MPKTEDGYYVKVNDLVWCVSDPSIIVSIVSIYQFSEEGENEIKFTCWIDHGDGEGYYPVYNCEVFRYQRNCLMAARRIALENIEGNRYSIERAKNKIIAIDNFLEKLK